MRKSKITWNSGSAPQRPKKNVAARRARGASPNVAWNPGVNPGQVQRQLLPRYLPKFDTNFKFDVSALTPGAVFETTMHLLIVDWAGNGFEPTPCPEVRITWIYPGQTGAMVPGTPVIYLGEVRDEMTTGGRRVSLVRHTFLTELGRTIIDLGSVTPIV